MYSICIICIHQVEEQLVNNRWKTPVYFTPVKVVQKRLSLSKMVIGRVSRVLMLLNLVLLQLCSSPCPTFFGVGCFFLWSSHPPLPEVQLEIHPFQRQPLWPVHDSSIIPNPVKLFLEYWINPLARQQLWKKRKKKKKVALSLLRHTLSWAKMYRIHSPSFSFFSWFSSAAVLSALKKILALLSEK